MTDVPTTWEELLKWCDGRAAYSDRFIDFQRWIAEAEARATEKERERCLMLIYPDGDDINYANHALTPAKALGRFAADVRARIAPPPPVDPRIAVGVAALHAKRITDGIEGIDTAGRLAIVLAAIDAMGVKNG
jgi:hypothetical protein